MATIVTRAGKGSPLTNAEVDANFTNLNSGKAENDGTGATGTWGISISGNAATVTDGVYTTGSYANPSWITSLAEDKVLPSQSGNVGRYLQTNGTATSWVVLDLSSKADTDGSNATGTWPISITGNANTVTNGVYTTGTQTIGGNKTFSDTTLFQDANHYLAITSGNVIHNLDSTDYWNFARATNILTWVSGGTTRATISAAGDLTMSGNVTAYSDERLKKDWAALPNDFLERLSLVKSGTYTRIDTEDRQAGVSAQDMLNVLPETVLDDISGILSVAYGNAALVACIELSKRVIALEHQLTITNQNIANAGSK